MSTHYTPISSFGYLSFRTGQILEFQGVIPPSNTVDILNVTPGIYDSGTNLYYSSSTVDKELKLAVAALPYKFKPLNDIDTMVVEVVDVSDVGWGEIQPTGILAPHVREIKLRFLDAKNEIIIPPIYDEVKLTNIGIIVKNGDKYGFFDLVGTQIVSVTFDSIKVLGNGELEVQNNNEVYRIDKICYELSV